LSSEGSRAGDRRGTVSAAGLRVAVLVARFNGDVTARLLSGAMECLLEHGAHEQDIDILHVPGAWELPQTAARVVELARHNALITLGCVIRGETPHFYYVCTEASRGLGAVARTSRIPVLFGVLTTHTHEQAMARAGAGTSNKGYETALAAIEMATLYRSLGKR